MCLLWVGSDNTKGREEPPDKVLQNEPFPVGKAEPDQNQGREGMRSSVLVVFASCILTVSPRSFVLLNLMKSTPDRL